MQPGRTKESKEERGREPPPFLVGRSAGTEGSFRGSEESAATRQDRVRPTQMVHAIDLHTPAWDLCLLVHKGAGCWNVEIGD